MTDKEIKVFVKWMKENNCTFKKCEDGYHCSYNGLYICLLQRINDLWKCYIHPLTISGNTVAADIRFRLVGICNSRYEVIKANIETNIFKKYIQLNNFLKHRKINMRLKDMENDFNETA